MSGPGPSAAERARSLCNRHQMRSVADEPNCPDCGAIERALAGHAAEARRVALEEAAARLERMRDTQGSTTYRDPLRHGIDAIRALAAEEPTP